MSDVLLKNLTKYISLTKREKQIVLSLFTTETFRKHPYILQEGDITRHETFVARGLTRTYAVDDKEQEHVVQFGPEDWWVGDLYGFLTETPTK